MLRFPYFGFFGVSRAGRGDPALEQFEVDVAAGEHEADFLAP